MNTYQIQLTITDALVSFSVNAETPEEALKYGREKLNKHMPLFAKGLEHIDSNIEVTGVY